MLDGGESIRAVSEYLGTSIRGSRCGPARTWCRRARSEHARRSTRCLPRPEPRLMAHIWHRSVT